MDIVLFLNSQLTNFMKKKVNIILLFVVLLLWSTVAWKSLKNFFSQPSEIEKTTLYQSININKIKKDTFELEKLNRDPFLQKSIVLSKANSGSSTYKKPIKNSGKGNLSGFYKTTPKKIEPSLLPNIKYIGYIKSTLQKDEMVILKVDENIKRIAVGKKNNDIKIKKIYKDSVQIIYLNKTIMLKK